MNLFKLVTGSLVAILCASIVAPTLASEACSVRGAATVTPVVELYTSEGCNSCPPADRWLSGLKGQPSVVALAFHVDYWDRLGWKDRFSSPAYTLRQSQQQMTNGARFSYTPQVMLDGADRPDWPTLGTSLAMRSRPVSPIDIQLTREGNRFVATIAAMPGAPTRLAAFWAVTEQGFVTAVKAGENEGATLSHDFVVREYRPVAPWATNADSPAATLQFESATAVDPAHPRQINLVIVNADSGRPVQAVKLGC
jgi:hypothetical protein